MKRKVGMIAALFIFCLVYSMPVWARAGGGGGGGSSSGGGGSSHSSSSSGTSDSQGSNVAVVLCKEYLFLLLPAEGALC